MRDKFKGYYRPTKAEEDALWADALLVMDTNVVLDFYRYHTATTRLYLDSLQKFERRLWLPYQVALEFHRNRPAVRAESPKGHGDRIKVLETFRNTIGSKAYKSRLTSSPTQDELLAKTIAAIEELEAEFQVIRNDSMPNTEDKILERVTSLFTGRVGDGPTEEEAKALKEKAQSRFAEKIPPGYEDRGEKPSGEEYGDYYLWQQLMDHAKASGLDVIFATEDKKSDWSWKVNGEFVGPRPELIQEFREKTGQDIIIYSGKEFFRQLSDRAEAVTNTTELAAALADVSAVSEVRGEKDSASEDLWKTVSRSARVRVNRDSKANQRRTAEDNTGGLRLVSDVLERRYERLSLKSNDIIEEITRLRHDTDELERSPEIMASLYSQLGDIETEKDEIRSYIDRARSLRAAKFTSKWASDYGLRGDNDDDDPDWKAMRRQETLR